MGRSARFRATRVTPAIARAVREWPGWFAAAAGAVLCVLGWYGVSGESVVERQVPYLASATVPGAALLVAGAVLAAGRGARRSERADRAIEQLCALLVAEGGGAAEGSESTPDAGDSDGGPAEPTAALAVPQGTLYHRPDCPLVAGKPSAQPVDAAEALERALMPCPVCEPAAFPPSAADQD